MAVPTGKVDDDGFQMVTRKSRKHQSRKIHSQVTKEKMHTSDGPPEYIPNMLAVERQLTSAKEELILTEFLKSFKGTWQEVYSKRTSVTNTLASGKNTTASGTFVSSMDTVVSDTNTSASSTNALASGTNTSSSGTNTLASGTNTSAEGATQESLCISKDNDCTSVHKKKSTCHHHPDHSHMNSCNSECPQSDKLVYLTDINHRNQAISMQYIVCYGLGNFSSCVTARYQFAFLMLLADYLKVPCERCFIYDPKFTSSEKELLHKLGFNIIAHNEEGKRAIEQSTLFYMPHCGKPLYNNLLWANWKLHKLTQLVIIGNSFSSIYERLPTRQLEKVAPYILKIQPFTEERKVKNHFRFHDIFNDTAIHSFPHQLLENAHPAFWEDCVKPNYENTEDPEIIFS